MDRLGGLVVIAPARRVGDPGSNPGRAENSSLVIYIYIYIYVCVCVSENVSFVLC